ncbi:MAG: hypothetical protein WA945_01530, partial [Arcobacteraceae bacterium]
MGKNLQKNAPFIWDHYSDQPHVIKDKSYKKMMRKKYKNDFLKMFGTTLFMFPLSVSLMKFFRKKEHKIFEAKEFYGIGVNLDKGSFQQGFIEELGVKSLIIRIPLSDIQNLDKYYEFAKSFGDDKKILLNIIQDRNHIDDIGLLKLHITEIFN